MLIGDFNNIANLGENFGGDRNVSKHMVNFNNFLIEGNLISIFATGVSFTWCNGRKNITIIFERLDKAKYELD